METAKIFSFEKDLNYAADSIVSKTIIKKPSGNVSLFSFDAGQGLEEHTAPFEAFIQIIEGNPEISIDKTVYKLQEGECIVLPANIPHSVKATGKFKMMLVMLKN